MKMSVTYMAETARAMESAGFELTAEERPLPGETDAVVHEFRLHRGDDCRLVLQAIEYPGATDYYLELEEYHGMTSFSFPLDSWKHFGDRVELKYYTHPATSLGLSLTLRL